LVKKTYLRDMKRIYGEDVVIECAQGLDTDATKSVPDDVQRNIVMNYQEYLGVEDLSINTTVKDLFSVLQPDTLLERFAARKANKFAPTKDFLEIKGMAGQV